jgi:hypothetical protein
MLCSLCAGLRAVPSGCKYCLCLDDDVDPHEHLLADMVTALENDPKAFMATGYPFDVPEHGAGIMAYCVLAYHLPLIIAFSLGQRTLNVWGGCMLFRVCSIAPDRYSFLQVCHRQQGKCFCLFVN